MKIRDRDQTDSIHRMFPLDTSLPPFGSTTTGNTTLAHRPENKIRTAK